MLCFVAVESEISSFPFPVSETEESFEASQHDNALCDGGPTGMHISLYCILPKQATWAIFLQHIPSLLSQDVEQNGTRIPHKLHKVYSHGFHIM